MTAKLLIREVGAREFVQHNGDFNGNLTEDLPVELHLTDVDQAAQEGERLCAEGNVEAFQVWELVTTKQRVWKLEEVA